MRNVSGILVVLLSLTFASALIEAQTQTGTVSGVVVDQTEAVIPGARIVLKSVATGQSREVSTNEQGYFHFSEILPGIYEIAISKEGFRGYRVENLDVRVGRNADLGNVRLEVGAVGQAISVESTGPLIESLSPQITSSFTGKQAQILRQGFAGLDTMALLTPGVIPGIGNVNSNGMQVAANGQRSRSTQFMLDGHQMNDITIGGPSFFINNLDAISEYQVVTNQFSAEYGRNLGATVNIITKGGTNNFHGSGFWLHANSALNARTALQAQKGLKKPPLIDNQWAATIGGPVKRDKLFFFFAYRGERQPGSRSAIGNFGSNRVLTNNGLNTLVTAFPTSTPLQIYKSAGPFARSEGSPACVPGTTQTQAVAGISGVEVCAPARTVPQNTKFYEYMARMDFTGKRNTFMGRYMIQNNDFCCSGGLDGYWIAIPNRNQSTGITHTFQLSPRMINEFRFDYGRFLVAFEGANTEPISNVSKNLTNFNMPPPWLSFGLATNLPQNRLLNTFQWQDNWSLSRGRHMFKAGIEIQRNRTSLFFLPFINGSFAYQGSDLTSFAQNQPSTVSFAAGDGKFAPFETDQFYYFQDDIRLRPNFTINLGLRYENNGQPINRAAEEVLKRESDPAKAFWLQSVPISDRTLPILPTPNTNFAPRVGFAYTPRVAKWLFGENRTVVRGGVGRAYDLAFYNILLNVTTAAPRVFLFSLTGPSAIPLPAGAKGSDVAAVIPVPRNITDPRSLSQTTMAPDFHNPYGQNWSLGIQRQLGQSQVLEVRYVGSNSVGQFQSRNANPRFTNLAADFPALVFPNGLQPCTTPLGPFALGRVNCNRAEIRERLNSARSNYHSLQVRYDARNWKNQFTGGASYTWSKGIDNVSEIFSLLPGNGSVAISQNPFDIINGERGMSNQNLAHTLALHYIWELPWFRGQHGWLGRIAGGWQLSGITTFLSGRPWTPTQFSGNKYCQEDRGFNATFFGVLATCRPFNANAAAPTTAVGFVDTTGVIHLGKVTGPVVGFNDVRFLFNDDNSVNFFTHTPFGIGRNNFRGARTANFDIAIDKRTKLNERFSLRYRMTMANAFNHRNFDVPLARADTGDFAIPERNDAGGRNIRMGMWVEF